MTIKSILRDKFSRLMSVYYSHLAWLGKQKLHCPEMDTVFTRIYSENAWRDPESVSGEGSNKAYTKVIRAQLPGLLNELGVKSILDIPCGDFYWMKELDLEVDSYIGADIVAELIRQNNAHYARAGARKKTFIKLDVTRDDLPQVDLVFCRDCLVHLSSRDVLKALNNIKRSGSKYLLTTTFPGHSKNNDIITGQWRPINLRSEPFNFSEPLKVINENYMGMQGQYSDKSMGLWLIADAS